MLLRLLEPFTSMVHHYLNVWFWTTLIKVETPLLPTIQGKSEQLVLRHVMI